MRRSKNLTMHIASVYFTVLYSTVSHINIMKDKINLHLKRELLIFIFIEHRLHSQCMMVM